jgi:hypothetical protein
VLSEHNRHDQATTRLVVFLTRDKRVPRGIVNHHRFDGTIKTL